MAIKDDIKSLLSKHNITLTSVVDQLNTINDESTTVQNLSNKLNRGTIKYSEVEQILNVIGYKIDFTPIETIYTEAQYTQQIGRGTRMAGTVAGATAVGAIGATLGGMSGVLGGMAGIVGLVSSIVAKEMHEKYRETSGEQDKKLNDMIEKQLSDMIDKKKEDK